MTDNCVNNSNNLISWNGFDNEISFPLFFKRGTRSFVRWTTFLKIG